MKIIIRILVFLLYVEIQLLFRYSSGGILGMYPSALGVLLMFLLIKVLCKVYDNVKKPKEKPEDFLATHTFKYEDLTSIKEKNHFPEPEVAQLDKPCFCRKCGSKLLAESKFCSKCGTEIISMEDKEYEMQ